jgi:hypothetical protein
MRSFVLAVLVVCMGGVARAEEEPFVQVRTVTELGFLDVVAHSYREGMDGTLFRFTQEGGQDNLYLFSRLSAEVKLAGRHNVTFLYQPLDIRTQVLLPEDELIAGLLFPAGTPVDIRYGFDFYRLSYMYDLLEGEDWELAVGASLQLRNATITFTSVDGLLRRTQRDVGPVPIIKVRARAPLGKQFWAGLEADGFYIQGSVLDGSLRNEFTGSLFDVSLRGGVKLTEQIDAYLNLRYLGGGARGTERDNTDPGDGYTSNWLDTATVSLGFIFKLPGQ